MKKHLLTACVISLSSFAIAGVPLTTLECKSANASISGRPYGEDYDIKIKIDNASIRYTNTCDDTNCPNKENYGSLTVVDALYDKVYTIAFANNEGNNRGDFYALPDTVKFKKTGRGYTAQFKALYLGDDPRSKDLFKEFVKAPGITLDCMQTSKL